MLTKVKTRIDLPLNPPRCFSYVQARLSQISNEERKSVPLFWKLMQQLDIALEVCPISNYVLGLVETMRNHPAASLFASGSPVVVSNDDPYDFYEAFMGIISVNSDLKSLKQLAINSDLQQPEQTTTSECVGQMASQAWQMERLRFIIGHSFLPSHNFMEVIPEIEKSEVLKILRDMLKGAVLHANGFAIASLDYRFYNLTYRENLYVCDKNSTLRLKFFDVPSYDCNWELLSKKIKRSMTMVTENPNSVYNTVDKAWEKFDSVFKAWKFLISYRPVFEDLHYCNLQELYEDNVMYAEIRSTLSSIYDLDGKGAGPMGIMSANSDLRSLKQLMINSLTYSSLSKRQQRSALGKRQVKHSKWDAFVAKLANYDELGQQT
ncbi:hypothetical protein DBV15_04277 [Temnothorax longispinosus]|uniref:Adenosine deaminase domain-containing protein n=1 Tax=Temnothorax longispinosus TaxID=300112 RepID=A0A4S2KTE2_9HYME|nr:hypothetical protein DBV15_04277 [Temnothorax longispinosus]